MFCNLNIWYIDILVPYYEFIVGLISSEIQLLFEFLVFKIDYRVIEYVNKHVKMLQNIINDNKKMQYWFLFDGYSLSYYKKNGGKVDVSFYTHLTK